MEIDPRAELLAAANADCGEIAASALWIDCEDFPDADREACLLQLQELAGELRARLVNGGQPELVMNQLLRERLNLRGAGGGDPRAHYLHQVLQRGAAVPLTASIIWIAVGKAAGLDICGIGLPGHFIVRLDGRLLDALSGEESLDDAALRRIVEESTGTKTLELDPAWLEPTSCRSILTRISRNLRGCYTSLQQWEAALRAADRCIALMPDSPKELRDRGLLLWRMGRNQESLSDLHKYLNLVPDAKDASDIREVMGRLRSFMN